MKQTYVLMQISSASIEPGGTISGHAIAYNECEATENGEHMLLPSGVVKNYQEIFNAFNTHFELENIEGDPILTMHVAFSKDYTDKHEALRPYVCAVATVAKG